MLHDFADQYGIVIVTGLAALVVAGIVLLFTDAGISQEPPAGESEPLIPSWWQTLPSSWQTPSTRPSTDGGGATWRSTGRWRCQRETSSISRPSST